MLSLVAWAAVAAGGEREWMPAARHFEAAEQGRNCSLYRTLSRKTDRDLSQGQAQLRYARNALRKSRSELVACARERGVREWNDEDAESLAAELCPDEYQAWLRPGYRVLMIEQDLHAERERMHLLSLQLHLHCRDLPAPEPVPAGF